MVCRSGYYGWLNTPPSSRELENQLILVKIDKIFHDSRCTYGTRRIKRALSKEGLTVSRRRINRLMNKAALRCKTKRRFKTTTDSKHQQPIAANILDRKFSADHPDQYYVGDITYIPTHEGWVYLAVVIDLFSRQVVGWSMEKHMKTSLVNNALLMAIWKRKQKLGLFMAHR